MHELSVLEKGEPRRKSKVCLGKYPYLGQGKENKKKNTENYEVFKLVQD